MKNKKEKTFERVRLDFKNGKFFVQSLGFEKEYFFGRSLKSGGLVNYNGELYWTCPREYLKSYKERLIEKLIEEEYSKYRKRINKLEKALEKDITIELKPHVILK